MDLVIANSESLTEIFDFISAKNNVFKIELSPHELEQYKYKLKNKVADKSYRFILGFKDGKLIAMISIYFWKTLPYFSIGDLFIKREPGKKNNLRECLNNLMEFAIQEAFKNKYYICYFITRMRRFSRSQFIEKGNPYHSQNAVPALSCFDISVEYIIPKNTRPDHESYWHMMGNKTHDCDLWVRRGNLKIEKLYVLLAKNN